jgi:hypothetical protein
MAAWDPEIRAAVIFGGTAGSWNQSAVLRDHLLAAVGRMSAPALFIHAENDYSTAPGLALTGEMQRLGKPHALKIYPAVGADTRAVHNLVSDIGADVGVGRVRLLGGAIATVTVSAVSGCLLKGGDHLGNRLIVEGNLNVSPQKRKSGGDEVVVKFQGGWSASRSIQHLQGASPAVPSRR